MAGQKQTVSGVAGRYAKALFELAQEQAQVDTVANDLLRFQQLLDESEDLRRLVESPIFAAEQQIAALDALLKAVSVDGLTEKFLLLIARNRRLSAVNGMIRAFTVLVAESRGEVTAEITAAENLTSEQLTAIKGELKTIMGQEVQVSTKIDESLLGGLIVKVGSRMVDNSLKTKLQNLKIAMKGIG